MENKKTEKIDVKACRTIALQAKDMKRPCIQVDTVFPLNTEEWAQFYYLVASTTKKIGDQLGLPFLVSITESSETPKKFVECTRGNNGDHEIMEFVGEKIGHCLMCIHCGKLFHKTSKTKDELSKHFNYLERDNKEKAEVPNETKKK